MCRLKIFQMIIVSVPGLNTVILSPLTLNSNSETVFPVKGNGRQLYSMAWDFKPKDQGLSFKSLHWDSVVSLDLGYFIYKMVMKIFISLCFCKDLIICLR